MVKTAHWHIINAGTSIFSIGIGFSMRFALGFGIDSHSFNLDIGPFWLFIEW